jgi:hypothetical protein
MKKQVLTLVGVLSLLLVAGSAFAQGGQIRATIPFNFTVSHTTLPAGDYSVSTTGGTGSILVIQGANGKALKLVGSNLVQASKLSDRTKLVFRCYGDRYFLAQVWMRGSQMGRELPKSNLESEIAMDAAAHKVVLVASR